MIIDNQGPIRIHFNGGLARSGSTVFELSSVTARRVVVLGKIAFGGWQQIDVAEVFSLTRCIDRTVRAPQLWTGLGRKACKADVREYASSYSRLFRGAVRVSGCTVVVVVGSSKRASMPYVLHCAEDIDVGVLHHVRDSPVVGYWWAKSVLRPEYFAGGKTCVDRYSPGRSALKWLQHNGVIEGLGLRGTPIRQIRHKDRVQTPAETVQEALEFIGLVRRTNPLFSNEWVGLTTTHTCSGNPMRFTQGCVEIRQGEEWSKSLPAGSRRLGTGLTAPGLAAYGYLKKEEL